MDVTRTSPNAFAEASAALYSMDATSISSAKIQSILSGLDDWDIIDQGDILPPEPPDNPPQKTSSGSKRSSASESQISAAKSDVNRSRSFSLLGPLAEKVGRSLFGGRDTASTASSPSVGQCSSGPAGPGAKSLPLSDTDFLKFLDSKGRLVRGNQFRMAVYQRGIEASLRPVAWRHLLNVYPEGMSGEERIRYTRRLSQKYQSLKLAWHQKLKSGYITEDLRLVANMVRKDVVRTDRTLAFFSVQRGIDEELEENPNTLALFNILTTYALTHPEISYCQGMSDLASPLLVVMKNEAEAYVCFCALMKRLRHNFRYDGRAMTRKFQHLSELVQYYDPVLFEYLRECHADDLLFCYRWLLLEMKREFRFDDALLMLEVMWASMPPQPPPGELDIFQVDITLPDVPLPVSPPLSYAAAAPYAKLQLLLKPPSLTNGYCDGLEGELLLPESSSPHHSGGSLLEGGVSPRSESSASTSPSDADTDLLSPHLDPVVLSCRRHQSSDCDQTITDGESQDGDPGDGTTPRTVSSVATEVSCGPAGVSVTTSPPRSMRIQSHSNLDSWLAGDWDDSSSRRDPDQLELNAGPKYGSLPAGSRLMDYAAAVAPAIAEGRRSRSESMERELRLSLLQALPAANRVSICAPPPNQSSPPHQQVAPKSPGRENNGSFGSENNRESPPLLTIQCPVCDEAERSVKASSETQVRDEISSDLEASGSEKKQSPVPVALEADSIVSALLGSSELRLSDIHEIVLNRDLSIHSSERSTPRSRHLSCEAPSSSQLTVGGDQKSRHASSASQSTSQGVDSGVCSMVPEISEVTTPYTQSVELASKGSSAENKLQDIVEFINVEKDPKYLLPPPSEFGEGNPFLMFLCLALLLKHRDYIIRKHMDYNEIAMYFDKLVRRHDVRSVLARSRVLYSDYLNGGWDLNLH